MRVLHVVGTLHGGALLGVVDCTPHVRWETFHYKECLTVNKQCDYSMTTQYVPSPEWRTCRYCTVYLKECRAASGSPLRQNPSRHAPLLALPYEIVHQRRPIPATIHSTSSTGASAVQGLCVH